MEHETRVLLSGPKGESWLSLPATEDEMTEALINIGAESARDFEIDKIKSTFEYIRYLEYEETDINELNYLTTLIDDMWAYEMELFEAIVEYRDAEDVASFINCALTTDSYNLMADIDSAHDLGWYLIEESGIYNTDDIRGNSALREYITFDYELFGRDYEMRALGDFTSFGWLEEIGNTDSGYCGVEDIPEDNIILDDEWVFDDEFKRDNVLEVEALFL